MLKIFSHSSQLIYFNGCKICSSKYFHSFFGTKTFQRQKRQITVYIIIAFKLMMVEVAEKDFQNGSNKAIQIQHELSKGMVPQKGSTHGHDQPL